MRAIRHSLILLEANSCPLTLRVTRAGPSSVAEVQAQRGERLDARVGTTDPGTGEKLAADLGISVPVASEPGDLRLPELGLAAHVGFRLASAAPVSAGTRQ